MSINFKLHCLAFRLAYTIIFFSVTISNISAFAGQSKLVAITQIVAHPSLDLVKRGITDELAKQQIDVRIIFANAQGSITTAVQIATDFVSKRPDVIIAISTPSAQTVMKATKHNQIPLVFATITDPVGASLVKDLQHPGGHITGTRNVTPITEQLQLIKSILPNATRLGIIINYGEDNSVQLLGQINANNNGFKVITAPANNTAEIQPAMLSLLGKIDALLLIQDSAVASSLPVIIKIADKNHLPIFAGYSDAADKGALLSLAVDEYHMGVATGNIVARILKGERAGDIPVQDPAHVELTLNLPVAKRLGINFSDKLVKRAVRLIQKNAPL